MKGFSRTDIEAIMRGNIKEQALNQLFAKFGFTGWYGKKKMYYIPFSSLQAVKADLTIIGLIKYWDSDREKQLAERVRNYNDKMPVEEENNITKKGGV